LKVVPRFLEKISNPLLLCKFLKQKKKVWYVLSIILQQFKQLWLKHHTKSEGRNLAGFEKNLFRNILNLEAADSYTSINLYQTTQRHIPEHSNIT
jgi:hypothetical protein